MGDKLKMELFEITYSGEANIFYLGGLVIQKKGWNWRKFNGKMCFDKYNWLGEKFADITLLYPDVTIDEFVPLLDYVAQWIGNVESQLLDAWIKKERFEYWGGKDSGYRCNWDRVFAGKDFVHFHLYFDRCARYLYIEPEVFLTEYWRKDVLDYLKFPTDGIFAKLRKCESGLEAAALYFQFVSKEAVKREEKEYVAWLGGRSSSRFWRAKFRELKNKYRELWKQERLSTVRP